LLLKRQKKVISKQKCINDDRIRVPLLSYIQSKYNPFLPNYKILRQLVLTTLSVPRLALFTRLLIDEGTLQTGSRSLILRKIAGRSYFSISKFPHSKIAKSTHSKSYSLFYAFPCFKISEIFQISSSPLNPYLLHLIDIDAS